MKNLKIWKRNKGTAIMMMNMGGPENSKQVKPFLKNLFSDTDLLKLPQQKILAEIISTFRSPKVIKHYEKIGGSPLLKWTNKQGILLTSQLDKTLKSYAPFKHFPAFRYIDPFTFDTLKQIESEGFKRLVVFSQYQQYSCSTSGSSFNQLTLLLNNFPNFNVSFIDRWFSNSLYINSVKETIEEAISKLDTNFKNSDIFILFTGHALPLLNVISGDTYISQVATTVELVMKEMNYSHPFRLAFQSQVGPIRWFGARTDRILDIISHPNSRYKAVILVPITFTSDHIETLFELDIELMEKMKQTALVSIVTDHILNKKFCSHEFLMKCHECQKQNCEYTRDFIRKQILKYT